MAFERRSEAGWASEAAAPLQGGGGGGRWGPQEDGAQSEVRIVPQM